MAKKQFKAESKRLLDMMINSIYTHKEIFLRELISNASDAVDKLCYLSLTDDKVGKDREDFFIRVTADKENRTITVSDNGIGMNKEDLESNLGVIARSGSGEFKKQLGENDGDIDIIGQFGVGFYSAFMVSETVTVVTKKYGEEQAYCWKSSGADGYTIAECERDDCGSDVIMKLKEDTEDENYSEYLEEYRLTELIKKYSDYIRYPIRMMLTKTKYIPAEEKGGEPKYESYTEEDTVNSMIPIWQRSKSEVSDEDAAKFYEEKYHDYEPPARVIRISAEGAVSFKALLFIPAKAPYDFYTKDYKAGLQLYTSGVMIMENCAELLPEHFRFVRGVVDSQDLSLNISREMLQHNRQLVKIASSIEKKVKTELKKLLSDEREKYLEFYKEFGLQLKYGIMANYGEHRDVIEDLLLFYSSEEKKLVSLDEYVEKMGEEQKYIYYACGENVARVDKLPQTEQLREKGYAILYLTDDIDEFIVKLLGKHGEKEFKSINDEDLGLENEEEKTELSKLEEENKGILDFVKMALGDNIAEVKLSSKLKSYPVCLGAKGAVSLEMEKYFAAIPGDKTKPKAERVLELNPEHSAFKALQKAMAEDQERARVYAELLYDQALLIADMPVDGARFSELVSSLMV